MSDPPIDDPRDHPSAASSARSHGEGTTGELHLQERPPAEAPGLWRSMRIAAGDIKLAHSVFALPFAILAAFLARPRAHPGGGENVMDGAGGSWGHFAGQLALVVACMVCARTFAMLVNRLADRRFDAQNPRTARRAVASGRLPAGRATWICAGSAAAFVVACSAFFFVFGNVWPVALSLPTLAWIAAYSFTKRFTPLCHVFLGGALAASPLAAALAVRPESILEWATWGSVEYQGFGAGVTLTLIALMVLTWVAGFDIIYALQDVEFDQQTGLKSIPARLGASGAIWVSRALHACSFLLVVGVSASEWRFGWLFDSAVGAVGVLLLAEHTVLVVRGKAGLDMAFFTLNGIVSCVLGAAGVLDLTLV